MTSEIEYQALTTRDASIVHVSESLVEPTSSSRWSKNARVYTIALVLFTTITIAQSVGALLANSMALLADCASMGLDAITYATNLYAECRSDVAEVTRKRNQLISSGFSFLALFAITLFFFCEGVTAAATKAWEGEEDDLNPYIVFGFAVAGIVFDLVSLAPYCVYGMPCCRRSDASASMNLCSALMHVTADLMRSTTTFVESILVWGYGVNGEECDAYATVVVSSIILVGLAKPVFDWVKESIRFARTPQHLQSDEGDLSAEDRKMVDIAME